MTMLPRSMPVLDKKRLRTARERVQFLMSDGGWHSSVDICAPENGGSEGLRRLRELRKLGLNVEKRRQKVDGGRGVWLYRATRPTENPRNAERLRPAFCRVCNRKTTGRGQLCLCFIMGDE